MSSSVRLRALFRRLMRLAGRFAVAALILIALFYCALRIYTIYNAHRVVSLLNEATHIQVGFTESSILPIVARYGGVKLATPLPMSTDDCPIKTSCEYENSRLPDYAYDVYVSPFHVYSGWNPPTGRIQTALARLMFATPSSWRDPFSLRDYLVYVHIGIRAGRVEAVSSGLFVEGRTRWLGNTWDLAAEMPRLQDSAKAYLVSGSSLTFPGNGGAGVMHFLTISATREQFEAAQGFNIRCVTSLIPCRCLSDLTPQAFAYMHQHPEVGSTISNEDCPNP